MLIDYWPPAFRCSGETSFIFAILWLKCWSFLALKKQRILIRSSRIYTKCDEKTSQNLNMKKNLRIGQERDLKSERNTFEEYDLERFTFILIVIH